MIKKFKSELVIVLFSIALIWVVFLILPPILEPNSYINVGLFILGKWTINDNLSVEFLENNVLELTNHTQNNPNINKGTWKLSGNDILISTDEVPLHDLSYDKIDLIFEINTNLIRRSQEFDQIPLTVFVNNREKETFYLDDYQGLNHMDNIQLIKTKL